MLLGLLSPSRTSVAGRESGIVRYIRMIKPKVGRMFLATCVGSFFILILYFQNISRSGESNLSELKI